MFKILTMRNCLQFLIAVCMQSLACAKTCCSETRCRCLPLPNHTYKAECLGLSINESTFPKFFNNVESVNLGENSIQRLPFPLRKYLPQNLKKFNISYNQINALKKSSFLHLENLTHLIVKNNNITYIDKETFSPLLSLQVLDLSRNIYLTFRVLSNISYGLQFTSIQALHLDFIHCASGITTMIFVSDVKYLANTTLREIYLTSNRLAYFESGVLKKLPKSLSIVDISQNDLAAGAWLFDVQSLSGLTLLKIGDTVSFRRNGAFTNCHDWRGPNVSRFKPKKTKYDWKYNIVPPSLREVSAANLRLDSNIHNLKISKNNSLESVDLQGNYFSEWIGPITNLHKLKYIDLSGVGGTKIKHNFFYDFPALETLKMNNNTFGPLFRFDKSDKIFQFLTTLKKLDISYNFVTTLPVNIFKNLTSLEVLRLSNNYIMNWKVSMATLKNLQYLDLSSNRLSSLQHKTMQEIDNLSNRNFSINLKDNVLQCTCGTLTFMKWMIKNSRIFNDFKSYNCQDEKKNTISFIRLNTKIKELEKQCSDYVGLTLGVFVAIILCFLISIFGIIYRYRWKLRYMYYLGHSKFKNIKRTDDHQYEFDAFISYANEDRKTVLEIAETLENRYRMKLQFHERDFLGGKGIAENITDTIHRSHKTVVMLSPNFLKSHWGKFEFNMAHMESIYARNGDDVIVIVLLEPIKARDLPLMMMDVIQSKAYIEYSDEEQCQILFFEKLLRAIEAS